MPDEEWGERVVAVVVRAVEGRQLVGWDLSEECPRAWAPQQVVRLVDALPMLANGKTDRLRLRERA